MKFLKIALATAVIAGFASTAAAQDSGIYVNAGVDAYEFDFYTASIKVGYDFNDYIGIEGQAGFGIGDQDIDGIDVGVDNTFAGFGVLSFPVNQDIDLFARVGYHSTQFGFSGAISADLDTDGLAAGVGGQYFFNGGQNGLRVEYTLKDIDSDVGSLGDANVFSASYVRKF